MRHDTERNASRDHAKIVGASYVGYTLLGLVNSFVIKPGIYDVGTFQENVQRFRLAQAVDIALYAAVIVASWGLFLLTRSLNRNLSLLALLFRFGEGLLGCVATLICLAPLLVLAPNAWSSFDRAQLDDLAIMSMQLSGVMWDVLFILMGIGAALFIWILHTARAIPAWLSGWGMFTYLVMVLYGFVKILVSHPPEKMMLVMFPGALFELLFGCWLLFKGINATPPTVAKTTPASQAS
jgi:hypothetical protein